MEPKTDLRWYALTVRHQHERSVGDALRIKGFETLAPFYRSRRQWSDRIKQVELPLFAGYVFFRMRICDSAKVVSTPGARRIVGFGGPEPISNEDIERIEALVSSGLTVSTWPYLQPGDRVRIERGPLKGLEGTLLREAGGLRLVASVDLLRRSIAVELSPDMVSPVRRRATAAAAAAPANSPSER